MTPLRDACLALAWLRGLVTDRVVWRGNTLRVGAGSRLIADACSRGPAPVDQAA